MNRPMYNRETLFVPLAGVQIHDFLESVLCGMSETVTRWTAYIIFNGTFVNVHQDDSVQTAYDRWENERRS